MGNKPSFFKYVILWSIVFSLPFTLIGSAAGLFIAYFVTSFMTGGGVPTQSEVILYTRFFAMAISGAALVVGFYRRSREWDRLNRECQE